MCRRVWGDAGLQPLVHIAVLQVHPPLATLCHDVGHAAFKAMRGDVLPHASMQPPLRGSPCMQLPLPPLLCSLRCHLRSRCLHCSLLRALHAVRQAVSVALSTRSLLRAVSLSSRRLCWRRGLRTTLRARDRAPALLAAMHKLAAVWAQLHGNLRRAVPESLRHLRRVSGRNCPASSESISPKCDSSWFCRPLLDFRRGEPSRWSPHCTASVRARVFCGGA